MRKTEQKIYEKFYRSILKEKEETEKSRINMCWKDKNIRLLHYRLDQLQLLTEHYFGHISFPITTIEVLLNFPLIEKILVKTTLTEEEQAKVIKWYLKKNFEFFCNNNNLQYYQALPKLINIREELFEEELSVVFEEEVTKGFYLKQQLLTIVINYMLHLEEEQAKKAYEALQKLEISQKYFPYLLPQPQKNQKNFLKYKQQPIEKKNISVDFKGNIKKERQLQEKLRQYYNNGHINHYLTKIDLQNIKQILKQLYTEQNSSKIYKEIFIQNEQQLELEQERLLNKFLSLEEQELYKNSCLLLENKTIIINAFYLEQINNIIKDIKEIIQNLFENEEDQTFIEMLKEELKNLQEYYNNAIKTRKKVCKDS